VALARRSTCARMHRGDAREKRARSTSAGYGT
jgi:hypothetical protein